MLAPWKKSQDQPRQQPKEQRHYFADKGLSSQSYGCSSSHVLFSTKKAECQRMDAFELWCWRRLLRVPWTARSSNQSILRRSVLNIYWKDWCWSSKTLAMWCNELTHWKSPWCWERLIFVFWMLSFKPTFSSPLSLSSRGFLVPLHFLP